MLTDDLDFAVWLRRRRRALDLTQADLADRVGCSVDLISKLERGERRPSRQVAARLAERLGLPAAERERFLAFARGAALPPAMPDVALPAPKADGRQDYGPPPPAQGLPAPATSFVGRAAELAQIAEALADPAARLLTLAGPGGIGKTRLALRALEQHAARFEAGARFVALAAVAEAAHLPAAIAAAVGQPAGATIDELGAALAGRELLLALDNCEHLGEALAEAVAALLRAAPRLRVLATSREPLRLYGERIIELQGLAADGGPDLFVERARRVAPGLAVGPAERAAIARICDAVGGMPLAIELAAAWADTLPCEEIARELGRSLDLLASQDRDLPARHRSIRAVFDQTWGRLDEPTRGALARLAVFRGGFTREAAAYVARAGLPQLAALVRLALLRRDGERYELHPLIRTYSAGRLQAVGESRQTEGRLADYYLALAAEIRLGLGGPEQPARLALFRREASNFRVALALASAGDDARKGALLCVALRLPWVMCGMAREGLGWAERALARGGLAPAELGQLLTTTSHLLRFTGDYARAAEAADRAMALLAPLDDGEALADARYARAAVLLDIGEGAPALPLLEACRAAYERAGSSYGLTQVARQLGNAAYALGDIDAARQRYAEATALARANGLEYELAINLSNQGTTAAMFGDAAGAALCAEALALFLRHDGLDGVAYCLEGLAARAGLLGDHRRGARLLGVADALRAAIASPLTPGNREFYERCAAYARGPLGPDAFAAALAEGAAAVRPGPSGPVDPAPLLQLALSEAQGAEREAQREHGPAASAFTPLPEPLPEPLTAREREVLLLLAEGASNQAIAARLVVAIGTVKRHTGSIFAKLGVTSRTQAIARARQLGLIA